MDKPRIRWVEALPIVHEGNEMILLRDTEGITDRSFVVSKYAAFLLSLMDGTRTVEEIQADFQSSVGQTVDIGQIRELVEAMDSNFFLLNDNYSRFVAGLKEEYEKAEVRKPCLAGKGYPNEAKELLAFLDGMLSSRDAAKPEREIAGILAPHIDYGRGGKVYGKVYGYLKGAAKPLIVLLGTCHNHTEKILNISTKDFATPLGVVPNSRGLCGIIRESGELRRYISEWPHRNEHSIELQLPILQFLTAGRDVEILPILTGSMHEYISGAGNLGEEMAVLLGGLREALAAYGKPYLVIAGADLAHIGAQFGDSYVLDRKALSQSKEQDEAVLSHVKRVDAGGFFGEVRREEDRRRICGLAPIYFQLSLLEGASCEIVDYDQWYDGRSSVSFAGGVFYSGR